MYKLSDVRLSSIILILVESPKGMSGAVSTDDDDGVSCGGVDGGAGVASCGDGLGAMMGPGMLGVARLMMLICYEYANWPCVLGDGRRALGDVPHLH